MMREIVLKVGAEGGELTLLRERKNTGEEWQFRMERDESMLYDLLSEGDRGNIGEYLEHSGYVQSFHEGLSLLDRYEWFLLHPVQVHPDFLDAVLLEVRQRGGRASERHW